MASSRRLWLYWTAPSCQCVHQEKCVSKDMMSTQKFEIDVNVWSWNCLKSIRHWQDVLPTFTVRQLGLKHIVLNLEHQKHILRVYTIIVCVCRNPPNACTVIYSSYKKMLLFQNKEHLICNRTCCQQWQQQHGCCIMCIVPHKNSGCAKNTILFYPLMYFYMDSGL